MLKQKNTKKQGDVGLGAAIAYFTGVGDTVLLPLTDSQEYDLVVDHEGKLLKVQVKTTSYKKPSGNYTVGLTVKGGNRSGVGKIKSFDKEKVELIYVLTESGSQYLIPSSEVGSNSITLCEKYNKWVIGSTGRGTDL